MLLGEKEVKEVKLMTPKGISLLLALEETKREEKWVSCGVRKDGGDDPDTTHGLLILSLIHIL